ncbi:MAG TPA: Spy/CpxP family protein refolding chaperone [Pyrinomonadaceae bacterium]
MSRTNHRFIASRVALALSTLLLFSFVAPARGEETWRDDARASMLSTQEQEPDAQEPEQQRQTRPDRRDDGKGELLARLNLSPEQREQIRLIRQQTDREGRALLMSIRQARRALDRAIYLEDADESVIEARVRDLSAAQANALRLRAFTELKIRRVLTSEQLGILRELRQQGFDRQRTRRPRGDRFERRNNRLPPPSNVNPSNVNPSNVNNTNNANNANHMNDADAAGESSSPSPAFTPRGRRRNGGLRRARP